MTIFLMIAFLFFIGALLGWGLEVIYRRFKKTNIDREWINPGFLVGPYLPLYRKQSSFVYIDVCCYDYT